MRQRWNQVLDQLLGSDPGLNRLRTALAAVASMGAAIGAEYLFVRGTGALQAPAGTPAAAGNHDLLVIAMLLGAMLGLVSSFAINDRTARGQAVSFALLPLPMVAALALGLSLGGHRTVALSSFAVLLGLGGLLRRYGPRGTMTGIPLFSGDFIGFFLHGVVPTSALGWLAAEVGVGALACAVVRLGLFRPDPRAALRRSQRSWLARARRVLRLAAEEFDAGAADPGASRRATRLRRQLDRLNESSLIIDAQLAEPGALPPGSSGRRLHERLFEAELGLTNTARFAASLARTDLDEEARREVSSLLHALATGEHLRAAEEADAAVDHLSVEAAGALAGPGDRRRRVLLHRLATSVALLGDSVDEWLALASRGDDDDWVPAVGLVAGGWLPGSNEVSAAASTSRGRRWDERIPIPPWGRQAVQLTVSVAAATAAGDALSPHRFYWSVIAAFITFTGVNTSLEQLRKAGNRVAGTVVGILIGSLLARAAGTDVTANVAIVLIFLFLGLYLFRVNYAGLVVAVTVMVSQAYEQLHEYSWSLLVLRLEETALGATVASLTVLLVLPLRTERVLAVARHRMLEAVEELARAAVAALGGRGPTSPEPAAGLADAARAVDSAFQALATTARPLRHLGETGRRAQRITAATGALRHYARNLAMDVPAGGVDHVPVDLAPAADRLFASLERLRPGRNGSGPYVRAAGEWSAVEQEALEGIRRAVDDGGEDPPGDLVAVMLAARDLQLIDGALAELAALAGLEVVGVDTDPALIGAPVPAPAGTAPTG